VIPMKSLLLAMLVGLMMVGCGEEAQKEAVQEEAKDESAAPLGENFTIPDLNLTMIWVEPGTFTMGDKGEQHQVTLTKGFHLGKHEVTQAQWERVMGSDPSEYKGADRPVEQVSWNDAVEFCKKLTEMEKKAGRVPEGMTYQLPTEAQWEYACRAGTTTVYSWGDTITKTNANYNSGEVPRRRAAQLAGAATPVGNYPANPWGFHDMHGNVWEWCADWYGNYPSGSVTDPEGPASGSRRVGRGGSWHDDGTYLRSAGRSTYAPSGRSTTLGFRVGFLPSK
jgi:formylglycine-generating enzyme required for sulfatase activity